MSPEVDAARIPADPGDSPLRSFWLSGFEGADHVNAVGHRHDPQRATGHLQRADDDYRQLVRLGIRCVRESLGWRLTERAGRFDFSRMRHLQAAAQRNGVQIIWTLWHYGVPPDIDYFDDGLVERFGTYAAHAGEQFRRITDEAPVWNPINEINFLSWAATASTHLWLHRGDRDDEAYELKRRLVRAALRATALLRAVDPRARFVQVEPVVHVVAPPGRLELADQAARERSWQWQAWDLISGRVEPELGGSPAALDLLGVSHYHSSQWEIGTLERLHWHTQDPRRLPLSLLLAEAHARYGRPVLVAETGHFGSGRAQWLDEMAAETLRARRRGVPVIGYCLYPAVGRPDWERADEWHVSGLWDTPLRADGERGRVLDLPCALRLRRWQRRLPHTTGSGPMQRMPALIVFSHLRWNVESERQQQLMTRLARRYCVLFVEEPLHGNATPYLERYAPAHNVEVLRPRTMVDPPGLDDEPFPQLRALLADYLQDFGIDDYVAWFRTPTALPMLPGLRPGAVVYDFAPGVAHDGDDVAGRLMSDIAAAVAEGVPRVSMGTPLASHGDIQSPCWRHHD